MYVKPTRNRFRKSSVRSMDQKMRQMFVMNEPESYCAPSEGELLKARRWVERGGGWAGWSTLDLHTSDCFYLARDKMLVTNA
jgi:hypothetical protein